MNYMSSEAVLCLANHRSADILMHAGMALGTGSALAHRAVDSVLGSRHPDPAEAQQAAEQVAREPDTPCNRQAKTFADCMSDNNGDLEACRYYFDNLQTCRQQLA